MAKWTRFVTGGPKSSAKAAMRHTLVTAKSAKRGQPRPQTAPPKEVSPILSMGCRSLLLLSCDMFDLVSNVLRDVLRRAIVDCGAKIAIPFVVDSRVEQYCNPRRDFVSPCTEYRTSPRLTCSAMHILTLRCTYLVTRNSLDTKVLEEHLNRRFAISILLTLCKTFMRDNVAELRNILL